MASMLAHCSTVLGRVSPPGVVSAARAQPLWPIPASVGAQLRYSGRQLQVQRTRQPTRRRRAVTATAGPQQLFETALIVPGLAATLFRAATAGFGVYCLLQWRTLHNTRKQVEHIIQDNKAKSVERAERLRRFQPRTPPPSDDEDQAGA